RIELYSNCLFARRQQAGTDERSSSAKSFLPTARGATAVYNSSGVIAYYRHADWLGSSRFASTPGRAKYFDVAYAPYGEDYADSGTTDLNFTGQNQDTVSGLYDFLEREYHANSGRWIQPDPAGMGAVSMTNPQSWNKYVYVLNNPTAYVDRLGLFVDDVADNFFGNQFDASNRTIDVSFDSWTKWNNQHTFDDQGN